MKKVASYIRTAPKTQDQITSMVDQFNNISNHAKVDGIAVSECFFDAGPSPDLTERERMLNLVDAGEIDCILIANWSRLSRYQDELTEIQARCAKNGVEIISCSKSTMQLIEVT